MTSCFFNIFADTSASDPKETKLEEALRIINITKNSIVLPKAEESLYQRVCWMQAVDDALYNPLYLPKYAQLSSDTLFACKGNPSGFWKQGLELINSEAAITPVCHGTLLKDALKDILKEGENPPEINGLPPETEMKLGGFIKSLIEAAELRREAIAGLADEDKKLVTDYPLLYFFDKDGTSLRFMTASVEIHAKIAEAAMKVDFKKLFTAQYLLCRQIEELIPSLQSWAKELKHNRHNEMLLQVNTSLGRIIIGGAGINRYKDDALLIIDLGGNDLYENNAGGGWYTPAGVAVVLDISGDDVYDSDKPGVQGAGLFGTGILWDVEGDDTYHAGDVAQGAGYFGTGFLCDAKGNDSYNAEIFVQGAGAFGYGVLMDTEGWDSYWSNTLAQGFASTLGLGILGDFEGNDSYSSGEPSADIYSRKGGIAQGSGMSVRSANDWFKDFSFFGGVGMLFDYKGNDNYCAKCFAQGGSYFESLGVLVDSEGNDVYQSDHYSQGTGVHLSAGILIDKSGDDIYHGAGTSQGAGNDRSVGILLDFKGNDCYKGGGDTQGYARKPKGFGLFIDYEGDDKYKADTYSQGDVQPPDNPIYWPVAVFLDLNGNDEYMLSSEKSEEGMNNKTWHYETCSVGIDCEKGYQDYFLNEQGRSDAFDSFTRENSLVKDEFRNLSSLCPFERFNAVGKIYYKGSEAFDGLIESFRQGNFIYGKALQEAIIWLVIKEKIKKEDLAKLTKALEYCDSDTANFIARLFSVYEVNGSGARLLEALDKCDSYDRRFVIWALGKVKFTPALGRLTAIGKKDSNIECRVQAIKAVGSISGAEAKDLYLSLLKDDAESVRITASMMLANHKVAESIPELLKLLEDKSVFVRREAAYSLIRLCDKRGFPVLIKSLAYRSLDNSGNNYGSEVANFLAKYANCELITPEKLKGKKHHEAQLEYWSQWWEENKDKFDLEKNIKIIDSLDDISNALDAKKYEEVLALLEKIGKENQEYKQFGTLAGDLNSIAWEMAASGRKDLDTALKLAQWAVRLEANPMFIDTLAEAYYLKGELEQAIDEIKKAIEKDSQNKYYQDQLEKFKKGRK
jgi:tetratricopeptide (TPR) repeat protein